MSDVVIVGAKRTAIGSFLGQFTGVPSPTLGAAAIQAALAQAGIGGEQVDEVIMGCVLPAGLGQAPARQASRAAGIPDAAGATTINKVCGSGMKAVMLAHDIIKAGSATAVVAGGMESMTNAPHLLNGSRTGVRYGNAEFIDHMAYDGLTNPYDGKAMGVFGDATCAEYNWDREALDAFQLGEHAVRLVGALVDERGEAVAVEAPEAVGVAPPGVDVRDLHRVDVLPEAGAGRAEVRDPGRHRDPGRPRP